MYYVNKIIGWCFSPLGMFFAAMALSALLYAKTRFRRIARTLGVVAILALWIVSCGISARWIGLPLEGDEVDPTSAPTADAIVLLGGGMTYHKECGRPEICSGADRAWTATRLFKLGKAPVITVSGAAAPAEIALLAEMGVDTNKVIRLDAARNTEEESRLIATALKQSEPTILLVTSACHMPRAKMLFERAKFEVIPAPTDYELHAICEGGLSVKDFFPSVDVLERNTNAIKEWVARACYALKHAVM